MSVYLFEQFTSLITFDFYFRLESEFAKLLSTDEWRLSWVNKDYLVCPSYPEAVVVPKHTSDETLAASASFRKGGRFPILSYKHDNGVSIDSCKYFYFLLCTLFLLFLIIGCFDEIFTTPGRSSRQKM